MKKKYVYVILLMLCSCLAFVGCEGNSVIRIHDKNYYIEGKYAQSLSNETENVFMQFKTDGGKFAAEFFPKYNEIGFEYSDLDFYIEASYGTLDHIPAESYVLEFSFDNFAKYNEALKSIEEDYNFLQQPVKDDLNFYLIPSSEFNINDFSCRVVVRDNDNFPKIIPIVATSEKSSIIRFVFWYDIDLDYLKSEKDFIDSVKSHTLCDW